MKNRWFSLLLCVVSAAVWLLPVNVLAAAGEPKVLQYQELVHNEYQARAAVLFPY